MKNLFLTGITGFVGGEVIKRYLDRAPDLHITAMIRAVDEARLDKRVGKLLKTHFGAGAGPVRAASPSCAATSSRRGSA